MRRLILRLWQKCRAASGIFAIIWSDSSIRALIGSRETWKIPAYRPAKKEMRLWTHFLPRLVQGFPRASLETRWKMLPTSFAAITGRAKGEEVAGKVSIAAQLDAMRIKSGLRWKPWIGDFYEKGGLMVIGETNYADADMGATPADAVAAVDGNWHFTENVVCRFCFSRKDTNRTFDAITYLLMKSANDKERNVSPAVWNSFVYMDVIQHAMRGKGWKDVEHRQRPEEELWYPGWSAVIDVIKLLRPGKLLLVGAGVACHCSDKYLPHRVEAEIVNAHKIGPLWFRKGRISVEGLPSISVVAIPNPGSARGFVKESWRKALKSFSM